MKDKEIFHMCVNERLFNTYMHEYLVHMYVCVLHSCLMPPEVKKEHCIPWILELGRVVSFYVDGRSGNGSSARKTAPEC